MRTLVMLAALGLAALPATARAADKSDWQTDYAKAREAARKAGKPILVVLRCEA